MKLLSNNNSFSSAQFRRLSDEQCQTLHSAGLEILERTGVRLHHQPAIDLLQKAGARVSEGALIIDFAKQQGPAPTN